MTTQTNEIESVALPDEAAINRLSRQQTEARYFEDLASFGWTIIGLRIVFAGALFPLVFVVCLNVISFTAGDFSGRIWVTPGPFSVIGYLIAAAVFGLIGGLIGMVWTCIATVITLPVVHLAIWSMNIRADWLKLAAFTGGFVAFIATLPCSAELPAIVKNGAGPGALQLMLFLPALATIVGPYGGLSGGRRAVYIREAKSASRRALIAYGRSRFNFDEASLNGEGDPACFQFRISHLLWLGLWLSLLFTAIRLSGMGFDDFLSILLAWLVYQAATLYVGTLLGRYVVPQWRAWRQSRST